MLCDPSVRVANHNFMKVAGIVGQRCMWWSGLYSWVNAGGAFLVSDQVALMCRRQDGKEDEVQSQWWRLLRCTGTFL